ncbi:MAG: SPOR domain-containing protein [Luminiphilus sp.]|nr:SPOR domain-containing protein [Luminiphilus sp.]
MDPLLKQRLVGTLVLVALGVVFWPLIFVTPQDRDPVVLQPISGRPVIDQSPIAEPESYQKSVAEALPNAPTTPAAVQSDADLGTRTEIDALELRSLPPADALATVSPRIDPPAGEPLIDEQGVAVFWVLQVATVGSAARAAEIVDGLRERGYKAFSKRYIRVDDELFRVQVGPNAEREVMARIKTEIDQALRVDSKILRYVQ